MGCISSKILARSGRLQRKASHWLERSSLVEEIILSSSKSSGDKFLALLRTSSSAARRSKEAAEQNLEVATAKVETINVSELLAGLEEEIAVEEHERQDGQEDGGKSSSRCASEVADGRAKSFRTVEEFDALVSRSGSPEQAKSATAVAPERGASLVPPQGNFWEEQELVTAAVPDSNEDTMPADRSAPEEGETGGAKRRARARKLGELRLSAAPAFDFAKSGSLRDWLLGGGQIFSPGSYVTPKFGNVEPPPSDHEGYPAGEQEQEQGAVFDPELVAQFEQAMEELSVDEERVLKEVLDELEAGEKKETERLKRLNDHLDQSMDVPVRDHLST